MNTSVRADGPEATGTVGVPLPGVYVRLVDDTGQAIEASDGETVGEIQVRGPNLFTEYLNRPDATSAAFDGGWFRTGDVAVRDPAGNYRIVGRKATDLIKSGGYKIGAGEIENALLAHPGVAEAAVTGEPDGGRPRRADRRLDRARNRSGRRARPHRRGAGRACRPSAGAPQTAPRGALPHGPAAQRHGQDPETRPPCMSPVSRPRCRVCG